MIKYRYMNFYWGEDFELDPPKREFYEGDIDTYSKLNFSFGDSTNPKLKWILTLDPSTTCVGFYLVEGSGKYEIMGEIENVGENREIFKKRVKGFFRKFLGEKMVHTLLSEKVPPSQRNLKSYSDLCSFRRDIENVWRREIYVLSKSIFDGCYPQSWKSEVVKKEKGKNRARLKVNVVEDLCEDYPHIKAFLPYTKKGRNGYDAYDAFGNFRGWYQKTITDSGEVKVTGSKKTLTRPQAFFKYFPLDNFDTECTKLKKILDAFAISRGEKKYNEKSAIYDNVIMCATGIDLGRCSVVIIGNKLAILTMLWKMKQDFSPRNILIMLVFRGKTDVSSGLEKVLIDAGYYLEEFV